VRKEMALGERVEIEIKEKGEWFSKKRRNYIVSEVKEWKNVVWE
jgi:hypothetical protein